MRRRKRLIVVSLVLAGAAVLAACGSLGVVVPKTSPYHEGAELFAQRCSGCHTLYYAGTEGSGNDVSRSERTQGPDFDQRKERRVTDVLYAIRNGGFSGAIMPQNILVGDEAEAVARFVVACSGKDVDEPKGPNTLPSPPPSSECE